ncbi:fatty acid desaturase [Leptolyngbyaceae cyanobacterium CCMR0082]|uniref:Fatty acid desaturase n=1 Tax=Adonisia turfae CCMR0082 TaxID=2304604 RepID=A0A6M0S7P1_9CYAN|nr:fatty acid desaturase [Adonisia turfae]MDV3347483.1 fatty acid desaturase [Leptothoe sp. LEGE 181152]NEZ64477.1 fatty acid desaturase [Adonisia turfae CCMR0082]
MKTTIEKSDFVLTPYMQSNNWRATYQVLNTLIPYILLWVLAVKVAKIYIWLIPPIIILLVLFSLRCFSLMHDCGHYSLFRSKKVNRVVGFIFGLVNAMPQYWWSRDHAYHHKTNGDWERYRGIGDFLSTKEYAQLTPSEQNLYRMLRHPLMAFPGGFFYLAFKPRIIFVLGIYDFICHGFSCLRSTPKTSWSAILSSHQPKHWSTAAEFWDILLNNIFVVSSWFLLCRWLGTGFFLGIYSAVLTLSAAIFINVFFVQHNFDGAYAHKTEGWDYLTGAIEGSSYLELPTILKWFTADISYHNIHHLSERIPNYNLKACHQKNNHLLLDSKTIKMSEVLDCAQFILWDSDANKLVSIEAFHRDQANTFS